MTWSSSNSADHKRLRFKLVFDRDVTRTALAALDATTGWAAFALAHNLAADTATFTQGTGSVKWNKTSTNTDSSRIAYTAATASDWSAYTHLSIDVRTTAAADVDTNIAFTLLAGTATTTNYHQWDFATSYIRRGWSRLTATLASPTASSGSFSATAVKQVIVGWANNSATRGYTWVDNLCGITYGTALPIFANGALQSATSTYYSYIRKVGRIAGTLKPNDPTQAARSLTVELVDKDGVVTQMVSDYEMRNRIATLYAGFDDVDETDMVAVFKGQVASLAFKDGVWTFNLGDLKRTLKKTLFSAAATTSVTRYSAWAAIDILLNVWTNGDMMAIDPELIDWSTIYSLHDSYFASLTMTFDIREPWDGKEFTERQIVGPLGCYLMSTGAGLLTLKYVTAPLLADKTGTVLTDAEIIGVPTIEYGLADMLNEIFWETDYDAAAGAYDDRTMYIDSDSITKFTESRRYTVSSQGLASTETTFINGRNSRLFSRFAEPYPRYKVKTLLSCQTIKEGDIIQLTHSTLASIATGSRGVGSPKLVEVIGAEVDYDAGCCNFTLLDTPWTFTNTVVISELSSAYDDASAEEHTLYGWIGTAADNHVGSAAADGYVIQEG